MNQTILQWIAIGIVLVLSIVSLVIPQSNNKDKNDMKDIPLITIEEWESQIQKDNNTFINYSSGDKLIVVGNVIDINQKNYKIYVGNTFFYYPFGGEIPNILNKKVFFTINIFVCDREICICVDLRW